MCILEGTMFIGIVGYFIWHIGQVFFEPGGIVESTKQSNKEYTWYRKNEPWRYKPYKDPECGVNRES